MSNFADRVLSAIRDKGKPCVVGIDPRIDLMPDFATAGASTMDFRSGVRDAITAFCHAVLDAVGPLVPAVKPQIAFFEQYGIGGLEALYDTIRAAKDRGLLVIMDAKRNDISSTGMAYANAFLGRSKVFGVDHPVFDVDCITVSPFLGRDSLEPFVDTCLEYGKGIFVLVKTSNPGSRDVQDEIIGATNAPLYEKLARLVDEMGNAVGGSSGYSSIGAVVGATFPKEAERLRSLMPKAIVLVPGYGAQGETAQDAMPCFNEDGQGAVINASWSITCAFSDAESSREQFIQAVERNTVKMIEDVTGALAGLKE